jgi:hypothetical protein
MVATTAKAPARKSLGRVRKEKQQKLLQGLPAKIRKSVEWITGWFERNHRHTLMNRYQLGKRVQAIHDAETKGGSERYGKGTITKLAAAFGWDETVLYGALLVARSYTEAEIEQLARQRRADDQSLSYSHVRKLAEVEDRKKKKALLDKTLANCWTVAELDEAINKAQGNKGASTQGRKLIVPKDLAGLLNQKDRLVEEFLKRSREVWEKPEHSVMHEASLLPVDKLTQEQVEEVRRHAERLHMLCKKAQAQADEAESAHAYLLDKLSKAAKGDEEQAPSPATAAGDSAEGHPLEDAS